MTRFERTRKPGRGLTLVEIIVVVGISVLVVGSLITLLTNFRRGYQSGEEATVLLQEAGMFVSSLRRDLINAVLPPNLPADRWQEAVSTVGDQLTMTVFTDPDGNTGKITYELTKDGKGFSIHRRLENGNPKVLVKENLASLTWKIQGVTLTGKAKGIRQLWVDLSGLFQVQRKVGGKGKEILFHTKIFPVRLNRQLN